MNTKSYSLIVIIVVFIIIFVVWVVGTTVERMTSFNAAGYLARPSSFAQNGLYEVVAQWQEKESFPTIVREENGRLRFVDFYQRVTNGFYIQTSTNFLPLIPRPLVEAIGTNSPTAYGTTK